MSKSIIDESLNEYRAYPNGNPNEVEVHSYTLPQKVNLDTLHLTVALETIPTQK